ncbi:integrin beta-1-B-like isoform X2 [Ostrea edulis]|uniref:integrin beta-1-B-like isoform X2 n=1 Tax=Ostrea edulis TaxID=37623 RepID=UPI0024AF32DF|nr:integrin beta-1-B-like isoform X2 [Ostrea edulis]
MEGRKLFRVITIIMFIAKYSDADCQDYARNSEKCNFNGNYQCGKCVCNEPFFGAACECDKGTGTIEDKERQCIRDNDTGLICSGRGECRCGLCQCHSKGMNSFQLYMGTYCECDDYSCQYYSGLLCGGLTRGKCDCGICTCYDGFKGENCGCTTDNSTCVYNGAHTVRCITVWVTTP